MLDILTVSGTYATQAKYYFIMCKLKLASSLVVKHANLSRDNTPKSGANAQVSFVLGIQLCCYNSTPRSASAS